MVKIIKASSSGSPSGRTLSEEYIKCQLFDYLCDNGDCNFGELTGKDLIAEIKRLRPTFDVDDVIERALDEGIELDEAVAQLADELD